MFECVDFLSVARQSLNDKPREGAGVDSDPTRQFGGPALMLARQRQTFILDRVREDGAVRVADLVRELGVSDMTVRRDLEVFQERGLLEKVHGGATSIAGNPLFEPGFAPQSPLPPSAKHA